MSELQCNLIALHWNNKTETKNYELSSVLQIKQTYMYKIMETSITQHIMLKEAIFALTIFIYNF